MNSTPTHPTPKKPLTGSCSCGLISWSTTSPVTKATFCHCKTCRQISGAPFLAFAGSIPANTVTWTCRSTSALGAPTSPSEQSHSTSMSSSLPPEIASVVESMTFAQTDVAVRAFCKSCRTSLCMAYFCRSEDVDLVLGTMDDDEFDGHVRISSHIFTSQKAGWYEIGDDGVERFERFPPAWEETIRQWKDTQAIDGPSNEHERGAALLEMIKARWFLRK